MSHSLCKMSVCAAVAAALAGCGGGSKSSSGGGSGGSPTTVTYTFAGSPNGVPPAAVATQIGTGPYTLAALTSNKLTLSIPSGETNFSVAYLCPPVVESNPPDSYEYITQASTLDGTSFSGACFQSKAVQTGIATVQVNPAAIPDAGWVQVGGDESQWFSGTLDFSEQMPVGTYDVPVTVLKAEQSFNNTLAVKILRSQTIPGALNGGAPVVFAAGDETTTQTIAYSNVPDGYSLENVLVFYYTPGGADLLLNLDGPAGQYTALPAAATQSGDYYLIVAGAANPANGQIVGAELYTSTGGPQSIAFPAPWSYAGPTTAALPTFNFVYSGFSGMSEVSYFANLAWLQGTASFNEISMTATANYQNGSTSMTIPDLSSLTGFLAPAPSGTSVEWNVEILQGNPFLTKTPSGTSLNVANHGTYTEP